TLGEGNPSLSPNSVIADKTKVSPNTLGGSNLGTPPNAVISDNLGTPPNTLGAENPSVSPNSVIADKTRENYFELTGKPITSQNSKSSFIPDIQLINQSPLVNKPQNNENDDDFSRDFQGVLKTFAKAKSRKATSLESENFKELAKEYGCSDLEQAMKKALLYDKLSIAYIKKILENGINTEKSQLTEFSNDQCHVKKLSNLRKDQNHDIFTDVCEVE
ncbi:MAG: hypothetical protein RR385_06380, partial [Clostridiales bacterium]